MDKTFKCTTTQLNGSQARISGPAWGVLILWDTSVYLPEINI